MKTSAAQFDLMVTFMEQNGDLSKPSNNSRGRITSLKGWEQLASLLNSDGSGDTKSTEKWKKVWSDLKNNTKKKAARLHRAASGTGGGPANYNKLSNIEQRVLNLIGVQVATGLAVEEAGLPQVNQPVYITSTNQPQIADCFEPFNEPGSSTQSHVVPISLVAQTGPTSPTPAFAEEEMQSSEPRINIRPYTAQVGPNLSPILPFEEVEVEVEVEDARLLTPTRHQSPPYIQVGRPQPALAGQTTPRRARLARSRGSPRRGRTVRPTHTEEVAQHFLHADEQWRQFRVEQHRDSIRIREMEIQMQREWHGVIIRALDIIEQHFNQ